MKANSVPAKLVEGAAKIASRLCEPDTLSIPYAHKLAVTAARNIGIQLRSPEELSYCVICRKGPFTKRGYYLHLVRVHGGLIRQMIADEIKRLEESYLGQTG